jgi:hypothetical protein
VFNSSRTFTPSVQLQSSNPHDNSQNFAATNESDFRPEPSDEFNSTTESGTPESRSISRVPHPSTHTPAETIEEQATEIVRSTYIFPESTYYPETTRSIEESQSHYATILVRSTVGHAPATIDDNPISRGSEAAQAEPEEEGSVALLVVAIILIVAVIGLWAFLVYTENRWKERAKAKAITVSSEHQNELASTDQQTT